MSCARVMSPMRTTRTDMPSAYVMASLVKLLVVMNTPWSG